MKSLSLFSLLCCFLLVSSCKKDPNGAYWDADIILPLMKTQLGLGNLVNDSLLIKDPNSGALTLVYKSDFQSFAVDSLVKIPDTSLIYSYTIPFFSYNFFPGQKLLDVSSQTKYNLTDIELTSFTIETATINIEVKNDITEIVELYFAIPSATINGNEIFQHTINIPAAPDSLNPTYFKASYDLADYTINMRGSNFDKVNVMDTKMQARINPNGNGAKMYFADTLQITSEFKNIIPLSATGYFGKNDFSIGPESIDLSLFDGIDLEQIQLSDAKLSLNIENGFGIDARGIINQLQSVNSKTGNTVNLTGNLIGTSLNINSANWSGDINNPVNPSTYLIELNKDNSNIISFIENLPDKFNYALDFETSPLGNISGSNDFIHKHYGFDAQLQLEVPLDITIKNLSLKDTAQLEFDEESRDNNINGGKLILSTYNYFPFETAIQLYFYDENMVLKDSLFSPTAGIIQAGNPSASGKVEKAKETRLIIPVSKQKLNRILICKTILIDSKINSPSQTSTIALYGDYKMDIKLAVELNYDFSLE